MPDAALLGRAAAQEHAQGDGRVLQGGHRTLQRHRRLLQHRRPEHPHTGRPVADADGVVTGFHDDGEVSVRLIFGNTVDADEFSLDDKQKQMILHAWRSSIF